MDEETKLELEKKRDQRRRAKKKYFTKKLLQAKEIECACGCGEKILEYDKYGRKHEYISGHNTPRKYEDPTLFKREWNHRNRKKRYKYKQKWLKKRRHLLLLEKGGECIKCNIKYDGTNAVMFDFHHREPHEKEFQIKINNQSLEKIKKELEKCDILCANCHRLEHRKEEEND